MLQKYQPLDPRQQALRDIIVSLKGDVKDESTMLPETTTVPYEFQGDFQNSTTGEPFGTELELPRVGVGLDGMLTGHRFGEIHCRSPLSYLPSKAYLQFDDRPFIGTINRLNQI